MKQPKVFLDSGAFTLFWKAHAKGKNAKKFYKSQEFWDYVDAYAEFVQRHEKHFDQYANVDTSKFPKITYEVQKYLEKEWGLKPLPVFHRNEDFKWLHRYIDEGYKYICLGGVAKSGSFSNRRVFQGWMDQCFKIICPKSNDCLPIVKVHGFAITSIPLMQRYPWYSVDSVTWKKMSYYGQILIPKWIGGKFNFTASPLVVFMDPDSKYTKRTGDSGKHFLFYSRAEQKHICDWLKHIEVPFGEKAGDGSIIELGVSNDNHFRCQANIRYFEIMAKSLPKWPWPFRLQERPTLFEALKNE